MAATETGADPSIPPVPDVALDLLDVHWERIQLVLRARRGRRTADDLTAFRLEREGGDGVLDTMTPTRAWLDRADLSLRFNVMQGPGQDPLVPGRWWLTVAGSRPVEHGRPVPIAPSGDTPPATPEARFDIRPLTYRATPGLVASASGGIAFVVDIAVERQTASAGGRAGRARRTPVQNVMRRARAAVFQMMHRGLRVLARRNGRRILFTSDSHAAMEGNLELVYRRMVERGLDRDHTLLTLFRSSVTAQRTMRDRIRLPWLLARADIIVIDDFQPVIRHLAIGDVRIVQLWHASGAFKLVGYSRIGKEGGPRPWASIHKNYARAIVSSALDVTFYAEAFGIPESRVIPTGIPRMDRFFDPDRAAAGRRAAHEALPATRDRFTILYAPTFRGDGRHDATFDPAWLDLAALHAVAVERDAVVIIRMHPFVPAIAIPDALRDRLIDGGSIPVDVNDLLFAVDLLVTDYSSILFEFSTLGRPMIFYAPDLEAYTRARDLYVPFEAFVPGPIVRTFDALVDVIRREAYDLEVVRTFAATRFAHLDAGSTDRVIDQAILGA